jgi:hypothetical protein
MQAGHQAMVCACSIGWFQRITKVDQCLKFSSTI